MDQQRYNILMNNLVEKPNIMSRYKYFNSVVLVPFFKINNEYHILFQKRAKHIRQGGEISFPGGGHSPESDKTYEDTAIRETIEEIGISFDKIIVEGRLDSVIAPLGAIIDVVVGRLLIQSLEELNINKDEVDFIFSLPVNELFNTNPDKYHVKMEVHSKMIKSNLEEEILLPVDELGLPERYNKPWGRKLYPVYVYKTKYGTIWGITAEIIRELSQLYHQLIK